MSNTSANAVPLGSQGGDATLGASEPIDISKPDLPSRQFVLPSTPGAVSNDMSLASSLRNKNKKNGFKRTITERTSQKIVFDYSSTTTPLPCARVDSTLDGDINSVLSLSRSTSRLIPPSEKQANGELPPNIFVTSIELEEERWNKKKKKSQRDFYGSRKEENGENGFGEEGWLKSVMEVDGTIDESAYPALDYGSNYGAVPDSSVRKTSDINWTTIERKWTSFVTIADVTSLKVGQLVGWKVN